MAIASLLSDGRTLRDVDHGIVSAPVRGVRVLPRVGKGISGIQVAVIVDAMLEEVEEMDDREVAEALRFVLHVTRGDPCPKTFESMLD